MVFSNLIIQAYGFFHIFPFWQIDQIRATEFVIVVVPF